MSFIRKNASFLAAFSCLLLLFAAPYLIPADPDSAVFRSGTLCLLLTAACFYPVRQSFLHSDKRHLIFGFGFGLLFAFALGVGSELLAYDGLLRGTGSLIRRFAVPVMAMPVLGSLSASVLSLHLSNRKSLSIPLWGYALIFLLCWLPVLLAFFPGATNYDFHGEFNQHRFHSYSNVHPLFHSALSNGLMVLGEMLGSLTLGLFFNTAVQMIAFAFALAYSCTFAQKHNAPAWASVLMTAAYAFLPIFSVMSISTCKDTLFSACVVVLLLKTWNMIEAPDRFFARRGNLVMYVICGIGTALLRNNGLFAYVLLIPSLLIVIRGHRRQAALLLTVCLAASAGITGILRLALSPEPTPVFQMYSIPAQQLVRAYNSGRMSEEDKAEIRAWYVSDEGLVVNAHLADAAKGYLDRDRIQTEGSQFLAIWKKHAKEYAHEYLEAFLMVNVGSWYPDDLSHASIYSYPTYLQLNFLDMSAFDINVTCYLPAVRNLLVRICERNYYQKYPIISVLFCTATPFWLILLACAKLVSDKRARSLPTALGALGIWLSYLLGPCTLPRYTLPLFCLAPALLAAAFSRRSGDETLPHILPRA